ncbi:MAG: glycosyltransferase family 4 protein [Candidatus Latescibacterota bacterium]|nr:MAG: glycosyltransferase family 4 protein [Candidatus Latescibacterota bacterium]
MRIAFVEPHLEIYGGIRRVLELSNRLTRLGEHVTIYHPSGEPCRWMENLAATRPTSQLLQDEYDALIFNEPTDYRLARKARARLRVFYILCLNERERLKRFSIKLFWPKKGRLMALKRAIQLPFLKIVNATWMQAYLRDELGVETELLIGGINRVVFHPVEVPRERGKFRILCSGDPREPKGVETIRQAVAKVQTRYPGVELFTYHGKGIPQDKMAETYSSADLFVDAQWYGGWNNPVADAMACGVPVVCTDIGAVTDFAFHEQTAILVRVGDADGMAAAIERMIENPSLRERVRRNGLNRITRFDWDRSATQLVEIIKKHLK